MRKYFFENENPFLSHQKLAISMSSNPFIITIQIICILPILTKSSKNNEFLFVRYALVLQVKNKDLRIKIFLQTDFYICIFQFVQSGIMTVLIWCIVSLLVLK